MSKAAVGNTKALGNLVPSVRDNIKAGESLDQIMRELAVSMGGAASEAARAQGSSRSIAFPTGGHSSSTGPGRRAARETVPKNKALQNRTPEGEFPLAESKNAWFYSFVGWGWPALAEAPL